MAMSRAERRAAKFGNFSQSRIFHQYQPSYHDYFGIQRDIEEAVDVMLEDMIEINYTAWAGQSIISEDNI